MRENMNIDTDMNLTVTLFHTAHTKSPATSGYALFVASLGAVPLTVTTSEPTT